jgi:hypothetical protein
MRYVNETVMVSNLLLYCQVWPKRTNMDISLRLRYALSENKYSSSDYRGQNAMGNTCFGLSFSRIQNFRLYKFGTRDVIQMYK